MIEFFVKKGVFRNANHAIWFLSSIGFFILIAYGLQKLQNKVKRHLLPYAENIASEVMEWLKDEPSIQKLDTLGSLRRRVATVGDIDIAVATNKPLEVIERFVNYPKKQKVIEKGPKTASILLPSNVQVDIWLLSQKRMVMHYNILQGARITI